MNAPAPRRNVRLLVGVDGGGTGCRARIEDAEGCVLGTGIAFPTVPEGKARIRTIMTATHTKEELEQALGVLKSVGKKMGILAN